MKGEVGGFIVCQSQIRQPMTEADAGGTSLNATPVATLLPPAGTKARADAEKCVCFPSRHFLPLPHALPLDVTFPFHFNLSALSHQRDAFIAKWEPSASPHSHTRAAADTRMG